MTRNKLLSLVKIMEEMKNYWNLFRKLILLLFLVSQMDTERNDEPNTYSQLHTDSSLESSMLLIYLSIQSSGHSWVKLFCLPYYSWTSLDEYPSFTYCVREPMREEAETDPMTLLVLRISNLNHLLDMFTYSTQSYWSTQCTSVYEFTRISKMNRIHFLLSENLNVSKCGVFSDFSDSSTSLFYIPC